MEETQRLSGKEFTNKILNGAALGIVVGLIPSAIFGAIFNSLSQYGGIWVMLSQLVSNFSFSVPFLVGMFIAIQFGLAPIHMASVAAAAFIGSGAAQFTPEGWLLQGTGDLVNTILTVTIAVMIIRLYGQRLPNLTIVLVPILGGMIPGLIGRFTLPYVSNLTTMLGNLIANFTQLQPFLMMVLLSITFAIVIVTPLSTVAIAYAISLAGLGAGAANVGIAATLFTLVYGSWRVNNPGTTFTLFFSGPKLFMANVLQNPKVFAAIVVNAAVTGFVSYLFKIQGTTASAGFGITGLSGPITALSFMEGNVLVNIGILILQYLIVPLGIAIVTHHLFTGMNLYNDNVFKFSGN
ncbi:PTS transporter subunit IIC [Dolosicoccus paucivorans]|uniref:PTS transporter subunit IIC n=1 Tax=Dolosicoccus paucivorans TaxID=84521 RepID=UPI00088D54A8|nr:PTS sugar transporter subunit IIC [Dolosicoccus paucivorans]SDI98816.1 hypothetical protein SAMN04487994_11021 [Dolosicoccus paucivorans]